MEYLQTATGVLLGIIIIGVSAGIVWWFNSWPKPIPINDLMDIIKTAGAEELPLVEPREAHGAPYHFTHSETSVKVPVQVPQELPKRMYPDKIIVINQNLKPKANPFES